MHYITQLDNKIFLVFNSWAGRSPLLDMLIIFFAKYVVYLLVLGLLVYWFTRRDRFFVRKSLVLGFMSFVMARLVLVEIIRLLIPRERPFVVGQATQLIAKSVGEAGFPSGHATAVFAIAMSIYFYNKKFGAWLLILGAIISLARVIAGVHYPTDVLGGAVLGVFTSWVIQKLFSTKIEKFVSWCSRLSDRVVSISK